MNKTIYCRCKSGCTNRRCVCFRNNESCDEKCGCADCQNPLNGLDLENISICAVQNIEEYKDLSEEELEENYELPCGCEEAPLNALIGDYSCSKCGDSYWYSFCWDEVVQDSLSWHCEICGTCRDWREWHCERCNRCSYGVTLACEHCGSRRR
jgi:hypothetical protein